MVQSPRKLELRYWFCQSNVVIGTASDVACGLEVVFRCVSQALPREAEARVEWILGKSVPLNLATWLSMCRVSGLMYSIPKTN